MKICSLTTKKSEQNFRSRFCTPNWKSFYFLFLSNNVCNKDEYKRKRGRGWPI